MSRLLILSLLMFAAAPTPAKGELGTWQLLYTVTGKDRWLTSVWPRNDGAWFAGGKNVLVVGKDAVAKATDVAQAVIYKFGEDSAGQIIAVGSGARVWEQNLDGLRLVHEATSPRVGRAGYGEILYGVGYLDPSSDETLVAYGPNDLIAFRGPGGAWETKHDGALSARAQRGPSDLRLPSKCHRVSWRWLARDQGLLACQNGDSYLMSKDRVEPTGRLPSACRTDLYAIAREQGQIFASCGNDQTLWVATLASRSWSRVESAPGGIRGVASRDGCLMAVTERQVWRRCTPTPKRAE